MCCCRMIKCHPNIFVLVGIVEIAAVGLNLAASSYGMASISWMQRIIGKGRRRSNDMGEDQIKATFL